MREESIKWWNSLPTQTKESICKKNVEYLLCERNPDGLTGREIEHIYSNHYRESILKNVKRLRNGENLKFFDNDTKQITTIFLNKKSNRIAWGRAVNLVGGVRVIHNNYLSLREVLAIITEFKTKRIQHYTEKN